jgi:hypothetical protein
LVDCFKSYELGEGSTVIEVKVAKTGHLWKFGFCRDMSLDLGVLDLVHIKAGRVQKQLDREQVARQVARIPDEQKAVFASILSEH